MVVVNSLSNLPARDNPSTPEIDESRDGIFGDYQTGEITFRAVLEEAYYLDIPVDITFSVTGTINTFSGSNNIVIVPDGSSIQGINDQLILDTTLSIGSNTTIKDLTLKSTSSVAKLLIDGSDNQIINNLVSDSVVISGDRNTVQGNFVGTDGTNLLKPSIKSTINVVGGKDNLIGGDSPDKGNVITGGIGISTDFTTTPSRESTGNIIQGNLIGTDATGTTAFYNSQAGIYIYGGSGNTIGGSTLASRNLVSGNLESGIWIKDSTNNLIQNNFIGTDLNGTTSLPNINHGILLDNTTNTAIKDNLISGNKNLGVSIIDGNDNLLQNNFIGTDINGTAALGNGSGSVFNSGGVQILDSTNNTINNNLISANIGHGIEIIGGTETTGNVIQGNWIGSDITGLEDLGNTGSGIFTGINGASDTVIGGDGFGNIIAFNDGDGVTVFSASTGNSILFNSIYSNGKLGIDLGTQLVESSMFIGDGSSSNDTGDGDPGANNLQNSPILTSITRNTGSITIQGRLNSEPDKTYRIQFFASEAPNEGKVFLGETGVTTDSQGNGIFSETFSTTVDQNQFISATATDLNGNTSEFTQTLQTPFEFLAKDIAYKTLNKGAEIEIDNIRYSVDTVFEDKKSGFYAIGLISTKDSVPPVLICRGTEFDVQKPADIISDLNVGGVGFNQYQAARDFVFDWLSNIRKESSENPKGLAPAITGHSLGGALAQLFAADFIARTQESKYKLGEIVTFNSPGINEDNLLKQFDESRTDRITHHIASADFVSLAGKIYLPGSVRIFNWEKPLDVPLFGKHLKPLTINAVGYSENSLGFLKPDGLRSQFSSSSNELSSPLFHFNDPDYFKFQLAIAFLPAVVFKNSAVTVAASTLAAALSTRATVEGGRQLIGKIPAEIFDEITAFLSNPSARFNDAVAAVAQSASVAVFNAISQYTADAWNALAQWGKNLLEPSTLQLDVTAQGAIAPASGSSITNSAWAAVSQWTDDVWAATAQWSKGTWDATTQWTTNEWESPFFIISDPTVAEDNAGSSFLEFNVALSRPSDQTITVDYATASTDGATSGSDYLSTSGTLTFAPNEIEKTIVVEVLNDTQAEQNETLFLNLSSPSQGVIADSQGAGTILGDIDTPLELSIGNASVVEDESDLVTALFTVALSANPSTPVTVHFNTMDGSSPKKSTANAFEPSGYEFVSGTLTFKPGDALTQQIAVPIQSDEEAEPNETFTVMLANAIGATIADSKGVGLINDDDAPRQNILFGTPGSDRLSGSQKDDTILGLNGNDVLAGEKGADVLQGGNGQDVLRGDRGNDVFIFSGSTQVLALKSSLIAKPDRILDFTYSHSDKIQLDFDDDRSTSDLPKGLFNAGSVKAKSLAVAAKKAYQDKDQRRSGQQTLKAKEGIFFIWEKQSFLSINDSQSLFSKKRDLFVEMTGIEWKRGDDLDGVLTVTDYFI